MMLLAAAVGAACRLPACVACACVQYWSPLAADGCRLHGLHGGRLRRPRLLCCSAVALAVFAGLLLCFTLRLLFAAAVALAGPCALPYIMFAWRLWDDLTTFFD